MVQIANKERDILRNWEFLPYRHSISNSADAVDLFLSQFRISQNTDFQTNGELHLYENNGRLAGLRFLAGESNVLKVSCGRLEPFAVPCNRSLQGNEVQESVQFLKNILSHASELSHLSTPVAPSDTTAQLALNAVGFRMADTILGYHLDLSLVSDSDFVEKSVRPATEDDVEKVAQIAAKCFSDRSLNVNRFNSEPLFSATDVGEMYASWAKGAILQNQADLTLVYDDGSSVNGFMTFKKPTEKEKSSGLSLGKAVLSAVDPICQKRGIYRKLLHAGCAWLKEFGVQSIEGKTQLSTVPVLRVWQSIGATLQVTYHTFHYQRN